MEQVEAQTRAAIDPIEPLARHQNETARGIERQSMRMRARLQLAMGPGLARRHREVPPGTKSAIFLTRRWVASPEFC
jgi:hypothetical protein